MTGQFSPPEKNSHDSDHDLLKKAKKYIRTGWITALICSFITLCLSIAGAQGNKIFDFDLWSLLDVFLMLVLAFGIYQRSRVASTSMFIYFIISKIIFWMNYGNQGINIFIGLISICLLCILSYKYFSIEYTGSFLIHNAFV